MVEIVVNGEKHNIKDYCNINELLKILDYKQDAFAVALNGVFISLVKYENTIIKNGDKIEILAPMQGG